LRLYLATIGRSFLHSCVLYLDVTSSCKSPLNTGVQRVVRGLYRALNARTAVTPLLWSDGWHTYCRLGERERMYLSAPFQNYQAPADKPETVPAPFFWSKTVHHFSYRANRVRLEDVATSEDVLLVPEIFQDERTKTLATVNQWFRGRRVAIFHDAVPLRLPEVTKSAEQRTFPRYVQALASFDKVICPSREAEADLQFYWKEFGLAGGRTSVQMWPTDFGTERTIAPPNDQARRILCVSSFHPRKNHLRLLEAAEQLWRENLRFELILVGRTTAHWGPTVRAEIDRLSRAGRLLHWQRHIDDESLHQTYRDCSFTVYPSVREGFGLPILESLWHVRPCVCGHNGALGEVARGGGCLLVDQEDPSSLADGMRQLLTDGETCHRLYEEARKRTFRSWDNYANALMRELQINPSNDCDSTSAE
jgi:glycosyltransferase involved in cell wall biosynthesis